MKKEKEDRERKRNKERERKKERERERERKKEKERKERNYLVREENRWSETNGSIVFYRLMITRTKYGRSDVTTQNLPFSLPLSFSLSFLPLS